MSSCTEPLAESIDISTSEQEDLGWSAELLQAEQQKDQKLEKIINALEGNQRSLAPTMRVAEILSQDLQNKTYEAESLACDLLMWTELKPDVEGESIKQSMVASVELLIPEKAKLFKSVKLSRRADSEMLVDMAKGIERILTDYARDILFFSLPCDETTDITNTAILIRGVTAEFETRKNLHLLEPMYVTTTVEDLFERRKSSMNRFAVTFEKRSGQITDEAPAIVGSKTGLVAYVKNELGRVSIDPNNLIVCHCLIHQQSLCEQSLQLNRVMSVVVSSNNFIKSKGSHSRHFKELLNDLEIKYGDIFYFCEVRWPSRGNILMQFY
ncbi:general transcription factor II-I repeat domain-containing protein 2-like [Palaemon carinicauda]|uniref:general transcription factor II-I repeat domain-containing protein 2-like n=1 Tax=Palaemon carinicauda TaxID=392227 RepID=UPI0035B5A69E